MALRFIKLDEAARILGVSVDEVNAMRERHELHGYRDGSTWKFKESDIEQAKQSLAERGPADEPDELSFDMRETIDDIEAKQRATTADEADSALPDLDSPASEDSGELTDLPIELDAPSDDVVLLSEVELGESDPNTSSTIIGKPGEQRGDESDIQIITDEDRQRPTAGEKPVSPAAKAKSPSVAVEPDAPTVIRSHVESPEQIDLAPSHDEGGSKVGQGSGVIDRSGEDEISLADADFDLEDTSAPSESLGGQDDSADVISADEESDFVLRSPSSSDITLGTGDSGISLADPADSGLSLEDPIEIGSMDEESLEVAGDALMSLDDDSDSQEVQQLQADEEFLLTPFEESEEDSSSGSGSQTIDLDSAEEDPFAELGSTESPLGEAGGVFEEEEEEGAAAGGLAAEPVAARASVASAEFSALSVVSLGVCVLLLALCGAMTVDLMRNMWSWNGPYSLNSSLMDMILGLVPG